MCFYHDPRDRSGTWQLQNFAAAESRRGVSALKETSFRRRSPEKLRPPPSQHDPSNRSEEIKDGPTTPLCAIFSLSTFSFFYLPPSPPPSRFSTSSFLFFILSFFSFFFLSTPFFGLADTWVHTVWRLLFVLCQRARVFLFFCCFPVVGHATQHGFFPQFLYIIFVVAASLFGIVSNR